MIQEADSNIMYTFVTIIFIVLFFILLFLIGYYLSKKIIPEKEKSTKSKLYDDLISVTKKDSKSDKKNKVDFEKKPVKKRF